MGLNHNGRGKYPKPFVKWAGGKGALVEEYSKLGLIPLKFNRYFEPFLGGGAMFFYLWRRGVIKNEAYLSDINKELISTYKIIKEDVNSLISQLEKLKDKYSEEMFYHFRTEYNKLKKLDVLNFQMRVRKAALFIYLNKTCYNGLYRENRKGEFNVPFGRYKNPNILDEENLRWVNKALQNAILSVCDFEECALKAKEGDFVYFDPPYIPISSTASFTSYHQRDFTIEDQERLAKVIEKLSSRGVYVLLSNASHPEIKRLYKDISGIHFFEVLAPRYINSNGNKRGPIREYALTNYPSFKKRIIQSTIL